MQSFINDWMWFEVNCVKSHHRLISVPWWNRFHKGCPMGTAQNYVEQYVDIINTTCNFHNIWQKVTKIKPVWTLYTFSKASRWIQTHRSCHLHLWESHRSCHLHLWESHKNKTCLNLVHLFESLQMNSNTQKLSPPSLSRAKIMGFHYSVKRLAFITCYKNVIPDDNNILGACDLCEMPQALGNCPVSFNWVPNEVQTQSIKKLWLTFQNQSIQQPKKIWIACHICFNFLLQPQLKKNSWQSCLPMGRSTSVVTV